MEADLSAIVWFVFHFNPYLSLSAAWSADDVHAWYGGLRRSWYDKKKPRDNSPGLTGYVAI